MRRTLALFLAAVLLLCGCSAEPIQEEPTTPTESIAAEPPEPTGFYVPESAMETATGGAVRVYDLGHTGYYAMAPMGEDVLLFSGTDNTTLTKVCGDNLYAAEVANLRCYVAPTQAAVQISGKGVTYFDPESREIVFLDISLKEVSRTALPAESIREPALSADRKTLYYCTAEALRAISLDSGLDRLVREMDFSETALLTLHCGDTVLECITRDDSSVVGQLFLSTETGETLWESRNWVSVASCEDQWCAVTMDGTFQQTLIGSTDGETQSLTPNVLVYDVFPVLEMNGIVTAVQGETSVELSFFDLESGSRTAVLELPHVGDFLTFWGDDVAGCIYLMFRDPETTHDIIYCWDLSLTGCNDEQHYLGPVYTRKFPDAEGLAACETEAARIGQAYGVEILLSEAAAAVQPAAYTLVSEYQIPVLTDSLQRLEIALAAFGKEFLAETAAGTASDTLHICLVRAIEGSSGSDFQDGASGLQFWDAAGNAYLAVRVGDLLEQDFHHELFHTIETKVLSNCSAYDNWSKLNPKGFQYDLDYRTNLERTDDTYLTGENRAFIDFYSMSFPKEDRARIFEYAMKDGAEAFFQSAAMQAKLRQLCLGIREAYGLEKAAQSFPWEQYLNEPLAYSAE